MFYISNIKTLNGDMDIIYRNQLKAMNSSFILLDNETGVRVVCSDIEEIESRFGVVLGVSDDFVFCLTDFTVNLLSLLGSFESFYHDRYALENYIFSRGNLPYVSLHRVLSLGDYKIADNRLYIGDIGYYPILDILKFTKLFMLKD